MRQKISSSNPQLDISTEEYFKVSFKILSPMASAAHIDTLVNSYQPLI